MPITSVIHPAFIMAVDKVIETIREDGYCNIPQFKHLVEGADVSPEKAISYLMNLGYGVVKTSAFDGNTPQEVMVDYRMMAAAMLLIYADGDYAKSNPVLDFVKGCYTYGTWHAAFPVTRNIRLLEDMYAQEGHLYSVSEVADNAVLRVPTDEDYIYNRVNRHSYALHELARNDRELNAVWELAITTFEAVNDFDDVGAQQHVLMKRIYKSKGSKAYKHFYRHAVSLFDKAADKATSKWVSKIVLKG